MKLFHLSLIVVFSCFIGCKYSIKEAPAPPRPEHIISNPSSAPLTPEQSMETMKLPAGFHLELVASEPEIQDPVAIVWDANGRLYVAEMRSYMQDIFGTGEHLPVCRITRFEDTDGDGKMDKHTVYIDSMVLPRMMLALDDRLVVNETYTYNMYSYRDTNGDGIADEKKLIFHNDKPDDANLEHQKSGLVWNVDNWIYVTSNPVRYKYINGMLKADSLTSSPSGQWGLTNDNYGRLFFSSAGGETAALNFQENPVYGELDMNNQRAGDFDEVWPIIGNTDVQGGPIRMRADSTLNHFTASCGQSVFRGDKLPASMVGDLFICEPVGRLIRRAKMTDNNGMAVLTNAYDKREFLASTDLNFRPVNTATGPDGCLYIVDMYHGIIQESAWTKPDSYIHPQIKRKKLDLNINRGRIYKLVHDGYKPGPTPQLLNATNQQLVGYLSHVNGWWRDNAQKLLVIHGDKTVVSELKKIASNDRSLLDRLAFWKSKFSPLGRLHALWTLEGLNAMDEKILTAALNDDDAEIRKAAIRMSEPFLQKGNATIFTLLEKLKEDKNAGVKIQLALSLRYSKDLKAVAILKGLQKENSSYPLLVKVAARSLQEGDESLAQLRESTKGMDGEDRDLVYEGSINYNQLCATCHGMDGKGLPTQIAPALSGSLRVNGDKGVLINIVLHGLKGNIDNKKYADIMVAQKEHSDEYIASVLSYIRNSFGNKQRVVSVENVKAMRAKTIERQAAWTLPELGEWQKINTKK